MSQPEKPCETCKFRNTKNNSNNKYCCSELIRLSCDETEMLSCVKLQLKEVFTEEPLCNKIKKKWYKKFYEFISGDFLPGEDDQHHDDITKKVYRRLILRHSILQQLEKTTKEYDVVKGLESSEYYKHGIEHKTSSKINNESPELNSSVQPFKLLPPSIRAYNLAVTDLFVEKALAYLNRKARIYNRHGFILMTLAFIDMIFGLTVAFIKTTSNGSGLQNIFTNNATLATKIIENNVLSELGHFIWYDLLSSFLKNFTFYGLIVTVAVFGYRISKAMFEQSERIKDRRHALRQGRLFVHLNGGILSIDEMEKAFNWNVNQDNAFAHFNPDSQAPAGNALREILKTVREMSLISNTKSK